MASVAAVVLAQASAGAHAVFVVVIFVVVDTMAMVAKELVAQELVAQELVARVISDFRRLRRGMKGRKSGDEKIVAHHVSNVKGALSRQHHHHH